MRSYRKTLKALSEFQDQEAAVLKACHRRCAERTLDGLEKNGSIFIKLGQHLSSMGYLLPEEWTSTFIPLQDKCPVSSYDSIQDMFIEETGERIEDYFEDFSMKPIGAASLAQVHVATLKDTHEKVAVKMQHPSLKEWVPLDLALTRLTFKTLRIFFPDYDLSWLSDEMESSLPKELDFALEGQNAIHASTFFAENARLPLVIPKVLLANRRILVMEYVAGCRPDNLRYLDSHGISRDEVSATLARIFNAMIFTPGAPLHCDPHGGNIAIRHNPARWKPGNFDIILYDHGLYRHIPEQLRVDYAKLWLAVIDGNETEMRDYAYKIGGIKSDQFPLFAAAITGREYGVLTRQEVATSARTGEEKEMISNSLGEGLLRQLVEMLGRMPRIILLILKTNDLTRSLDEGLHTREGPMRAFLILARYASQTVWQDRKEDFLRRGHWFHINDVLELISSWTKFCRIELKLFLYEAYLSTRRLWPIKGS